MGDGGRQWLLRQPRKFRWSRAYQYQKLSFKLKDTQHPSSDTGGVQRRLLELWCQAVAPEAAAAFQLCYTTSLERNDEVMDSCSEQVHPVLTPSTEMSCCRTTR